MSEEYYNNDIERQTERDTETENVTENQPDGFVENRTFQPDDQGMQSGRKKKEKKPMTTGRKWASLIAMALVFGLVAGGTMFGVNTAAEHLTGRDKAQIGQTQTTSASSSGSSNSSGQGTVSEVAANAMPSLVTISTMTVEEMRNFFGAGKSI